MRVALTAAIIIALGLIVAGFAYGGRYEIQRGPDYMIIRVDKFTGEVSMCGPDEVTKVVACVGQQIER